MPLLKKKLKDFRCKVIQDKIYIVKIYDDGSESDPIPTKFRDWEAGYWEEEPHPDFIKWLKDFRATYVGKEEMVEWKINPIVSRQLEAILIRAELDFFPLDWDEDKEEDNDSLAKFYLAQLERVLRFQQKYGPKLKAGARQLLGWVIVARLCDCKKVGAGDQASKLLSKFKTQKETTE